MKPGLKNLAGRAIRIRRDERGSATIEFVILFPLLISLVLMSVEIGVMTMRGLMLDRGMDIAMRSLRLGAMNPMTHNQLKREICKNALVIPECEQSISVEMQPGVTANWTAPSSRPTCADKSEPVQPVLQFTPGASNQLMVVTACATFDPFFPTTGLAATIRLDGAGEYALIATAAYVNEP